MINQQENLKNVNQYSAIGLAYIGDGVYELLVRERMIAKGNFPVNQLHRKTVSFVRAAAQSEAFSIIEEHLTENEMAIFKRGRNANSNTIPKNANPADYRRATGFESLFGYLYLLGENDRIYELFNIIFDKIDQ
ncbi:MAG: ribonuclease III domain-containing protein [Oscillospiraceae bacterium]